MLISCRDLSPNRPFQESISIKYLSEYKRKFCTQNANALLKRHVVLTFLCFLIKCSNRYQRYLGTRYPATQVSREVPCVLRYQVPKYPGTQVSRQVHWVLRYQVPKYQGTQTGTQALLL